MRDVPEPLFDQQLNAYHAQYVSRRSARTVRALAGAARIRRLTSKGPGFALPGAGVGQILTDGDALSAARRAYTQGQAKYGDLMGLMDRTAADPTDLLAAFQSSVGAGKGQTIYKQTPMGGMLGLRLNEQDVWLPTAHGPFMLTPSRDAVGGVSMKVTGVKDRLELSTHLATTLFEEGKHRKTLSRKIRTEIMEAMSGLRGAHDESGLMWPALGGNLDFLKMNRGSVA
ncbi:MAG: hypothetical protein ACXABY_14855, partial [Candidatus Thorarchaeota archaeon]